MIIASDFYKQNKDEINHLRAKTKMLGNEGLDIKRATFSVAYNNHDKNSEFCFTFDNSTYSDIMSISEYVNNTVTSGCKIRVDYHTTDFHYINTSISIIDEQISDQDYMVAISSRGTTIDEIYLPHRTGKTGIKDLDCNRICVGVDIDKSNLSYDSYCICGVGVDISNCCNNRHYDYVYLNNISYLSSKCFVNCTIDKLVIDSINIKSFGHLNSILTYTKVKEFEINDYNLCATHLRNRLEYFRHE